MKRGKTILLILISLLILIFLIRFFSPKEIDDINPNIQCQEKLLEKSDILWVIPKFENKSISENKEWCNYILNLNKTLGMHGVYHIFNEFNQTRNNKYIQEGINIYEKCFESKPELFKPPQLKISKENKKLIKEIKLKRKGIVNQFFHKVYHCKDTGIFPNWFIDLF